MNTIDLTKFDKSRFANIPYQQKVDKPWGYEIILTSPALDLPYTGKIIHINAGHRFSLQVHDKKLETLCLVRGEAYLIIDGQDGELKEFKMTLNHGYTVQIGQRHRIAAKNQDSDVIEVSMLEKGTTYRLEDDYNRGHETEETRRNDRAQK